VLRVHGVRKVVLLGASLGGTSAVVAAAEIRPRVAAVIDLSGPDQISGLDALQAAPKLQVRALYAVATGDDFIADVRKTFKATPPSLRRLVLVGGDGHGHGVSLLMADVQPHALRTRAVVESFIREHTSSR
jgi:pimeloyl-ACP methyl ester carboxylesterase